MPLRLTIFFALATLLFAACGNEPSNSANHDGALPHNLELTGNTSDAENAELAAAKGKIAAMVAPPDLIAKIKGDTAALLVVNFWKADCLKCIEIQQTLQSIQSNGNEGKLQLITVNLDDEPLSDGVNLVLRKSGITAETYQIKANDSKWMSEISSGWTGKVPAVFIKAKDGIQQFHARDLSKEELGAMLQPLLL